MYTTTKLTVALGQMRTAALILIAFAVFSAQSLASITILQYFGNASVFNPSTGRISDFFDVTGTGVGGTASVTTGSSSSTTNSVLTLSGDSAVFAFSHNQARSGEDFSGSFADSAGSALVLFSTDVAVPFSASGSYTSSNGFTSFQSSLQPLIGFDPSSGFYGNLQASSDGGNFILGGMDGNVSNIVSGSLTGTLVPFERYLLTFDSFIRTTFGGDDGATASGSVTLIIGDPPPTDVIPEPASVVVWSLLATALVAIGYFRTSALIRRQWER